MDILSGKHTEPHLCVRVISYITGTPLLYYPLLIIGAVWLLVQTATILNGIRVFLFRKRLNLAKRYGEGTWVVITGASDGIGKGFCEEFARLGFNIVLIARNQAKLSNVESELKKINTKIQTKIVVADFKDSAKPQFFDKIHEQLQGLDISILINNVGTVFQEFFEEFDEDNLKEMTIVNTLPMVILSKKLIPPMLNRSKRSAIINVSSFAGSAPIPYYSVYSASKAYMDYLSQGLSYEVKRKVDIMSLMPLHVETRMSGGKGSDTITVEQCVDGCLRDLGRTNFTYGHWIHKLQAYITSCLPDWLREAMIMKINPERLKKLAKLR